MNTAERSSSTMNEQSYMSRKSDSALYLVGTLIVYKNFTSNLFDNVQSIKTR